MKILIINPNQFGYTAGYFHYCKFFVQRGYLIDYICINEGMPKIELNGVNVKYLSISKVIFNWRLVFLRYFIKFDFRQYNIIFLNHHRFMFLYRLVGLPSRTILDIRTGDLSAGYLTRNFRNWLIKIDTLFFKNITILSVSLLYKLRLNPKICTILPLGADIISIADKKFNNLHLLYVGTFYKRNIPQTIKGIALFFKKNPTIPFIYDIIGFGNESDEQEVRKTIINEKLQDKVIFHGRKDHAELKPFFDKANVGISYIPITPFFDCQPPTKTFEYILSGMVCIATNTSENQRFISKGNGVLCIDNAISFCGALTEFYENREFYNCEKIRDSLKNHQWSNIVGTILEPLFISLSKTN